MNIFFYCTFTNEQKWFQAIKKKFKGHKIFTINDSFNYKKIDVAIVWKLPNNILYKLINIRLIFSLGAGVDHILQLSNYNNTPIIRIKDPNMRERMFNHILSQILNYQLKLNLYNDAQIQNIWISERETKLNRHVKIGILGLGYIGGFVGKRLQKLKYNVLGYRKYKLNSKMPFEVLTGDKLNVFVSEADILVSILPSTFETIGLINKKFLNIMKKNSLLINVGRGSTLNEHDLIKHLDINNNFYASLDVFKKEPLKRNHKFVSLKLYSYLMFFPCW